MLAFDPHPLPSHVHVTNSSQTATLELKFCGQRLSTAYVPMSGGDGGKASVDRLLPPQAAVVSCYSVAEEIMPGRADFLEELRGFEP
jgi:hypothetical protein